MEEVLSDAERASRLAAGARRRGACLTRLTARERLWDSQPPKDAAERAIWLAWLQEWIVKYDQCHEDVLQYTIGDGPEGIQAEYDEQVQQRVLRMRVLLQHEDMSVDIVRRQSMQQSQSTALENEYHGAQRTSTVKLPILKIEPFSGEAGAWYAFSDSFESAIGRREDLDDVQKFQYLRGVLEGDALALVRNLPSSAANYPVALSLLRQRYDDPAAIAYTLVNRIQSGKLAGSDISSLTELSATMTEVSPGLAALGSQWFSADALIVCLSLGKLDREMRVRWEQVRTAKGVSREAPRISEVSEFLNAQLRALDGTGKSHEAQIPKDFGARKSQVNATMKSREGERLPSMCAVDNEAHQTFRCRRFQEMSVQERIKLVQSKNLCQRCLVSGHAETQCPYTWGCRVCNGPHNTMIHSDNNHPGQQNCCTARTQVSNPAPLLPTASVAVHGKKEKVIFLRTLLDSGAQLNMVLESVLKDVHHVWLAQRGVVEFTGVGGADGGVSKGLVRLWFDCNGETKECTAHVVKHIQTLPGGECITSLESQLNGELLADPGFYRAGPVELLMGAGEFLPMIYGEKIPVNDRTLALKTMLGWVICSTQQPELQGIVATLSAQDKELNDCLERFWKIEEVPSAALETAEEILCKKDFQETFSRAGDGRFIVHMPLKGELCELGESRQIALRRLHQMEGKFLRDPLFKERYVNFMREYQDMGHMIPLPQKSKGIVYYLPHHGITREESSTTKLRVVFDATVAPIRGKSLNGILAVGKLEQESLFSLILRFRLFRWCLKADIAKMYRQIWIQQDQKDLQRIVWRESAEKPVQDYVLQTVTYGTSAAPHLAISVLNHIAIIAKKNWPEAAKMIQISFYMDDLLGGVHSEEIGRRRVKELREILGSAGMDLRKWVSNSPHILQDLPNSAKEKVDESNLGEEMVKSLGIQWMISQDEFVYKFDLSSVPVTTKRELLQEVSRIFDPLGWLSPVIILAKCLFQALWKEKSIGWDNRLPDSILWQWEKLRTEFKGLTEMKIPRWIGTVDGSLIDLHVFSDASESAYGACIYGVGEFGTALLASKARVAPLGGASVPRLELMGMVVGCKLLDSVLAAMAMEISVVIKGIYAWTDSMVVLGWLRAWPRKFQTFVHNRISLIITSPVSEFRFVPTMDNPADLCSRGVLPGDLKHCELWWKGPRWLTNSSNWPVNLSNTSEELPEIKEERPVIMIVEKEAEDWIEQLLRRCGSWKIVVGAVAIVQRMLCKFRQFRGQLLISVEERKEAELTVWRHEQWKYWPDVCRRMEAGKCLKSKDSLLSLRPVWIESVLRVGGRLSNAEVAFEQQHPILVPGESAVGPLMIREVHENLRHAGTATVVGALLRRVWILKMRQRVKSLLGKCVICRKFNQVPLVPIMAELPRMRLMPNIAFTCVGMDLAGPFSAVYRHSRGKQVCYSGYILVIVCLFSRAIHLEHLEGLSASALISGLSAFAGRRSRPSEIWSDNGTNFVAVSKDLEHQEQSLREVYNSAEVSNWIAAQGVKWHFITPRAPHKGGIWEAAVKQVKRLFYKSTGHQKLSTIEWCHLLPQIEGILNSRPMIRAPPDSGEEALSPAHFLVFKPLVSFPEQIGFQRTRYGERWSLLLSILQQYWLDWKKWYLNEYQVRGKWFREQTALKKDDIVLVKDLDNDIGYRIWPLGRVIETFAANDGCIRSALVRTNQGTYRRPVSKLVVLLEDIPSWRPVSGSS